MTQISDKEYQKLLNREAFYEKSPDLCYQISPDGKIGDCNKRVLQVLGYTKKELIGKPLITTIYAPSSQKKAEALFERWKKEGRVDHEELQIKTKSGKIIDTELSADAVRDGQGNIIYSVSVQRIISRHKKVKKQLNLEREQLLSIFESIDEPIYTSDPNTYEILYANHALRERFGDVVGKKCYQVLQGIESPCSFCTNKYIFGKNIGKPYIWEFQNKVNKRWYRCIDKAIRWPATNRLVRYEMAIDITDRKLAEEKVQQGAEDLSLLNSLNSAANRGESLEKIISLLSKGTSKIFHSFPATVYLLSNDCEYLVMQSPLSIGAASKRIEKIIGMKIPEVKIRLKKGSVYLETLKSGKAKIFNDAETIKKMMAECTENKMLKKLVPKIYSLLDICSVMSAPLISDGEAIGLMDISRQESFTQSDLKRFSTIAEEVTVILRRKEAEKETGESYEKLQELVEEVIHTITLTVESKDLYTAGHQKKVAQLAIAIAKEMRLSKELVEGIKWAATIHDIGKIHVPANILSKPSSLTEVEYDLVKTHPTVGYDILKGIKFPWPVVQIVLQHHERLDGSGYPQGLSSKDIILLARILAVADVVEAMTSHRPYRPAHSLDEALEEISRNKGTLYDSKVVDTCLKLFTKKGFKFD